MVDYYNFLGWGLKLFCGLLDRPVNSNTWLKLSDLLIQIELGACYELGNEIGLRALNSLFNEILEDKIIIALNWLGKLGLEPL